MSTHHMPCEICAEELEEDYGVWLCGKLCCKACIEVLFDLVYKRRLETDIGVVTRGAWRQCSCFAHQHTEPPIPPTKPPHPACEACCSGRHKECAINVEVRGTL